MKRKKLHRSGSQASSMLIMKHRGKCRLGARDVPSEVTFVVSVLSARDFISAVTTYIFNLVHGGVRPPFVRFSTAYLVKMSWCRASPSGSTTVYLVNAVTSLVPLVVAFTGIVTLCMLMCVCVHFAEIDGTSFERSKKVVFEECLLLKPQFDYRLYSV